MKNFNKAILALILLLSTSFFSLITTTQRLFLINSYVYKTLIIGLVIGTIIVNLMFNSEQYQKAKNMIFLPSTIMMLIAFIAVMIGTQIVYQQTILTTIKNSYFYGMLVVYFWLTIFTEDDFFDYILTLTAWISGLYALIIMIQSMLYIHQGPVFLDYGQFGLNPLFGNLGLIFGFPRIAVAADFISFGLLISLVGIMMKRTKRNIIINSCLAGLDLFFIIFISGTRMYIMIDLLMVAYTIAVMLWQKYKVLVVTAGSFVITLVLVALPTIAKGFTSGERSVSYDIRKEEIVYYFNQIFKHHFLGIGFPDAKRFDQILHGFHGITLQHFGPQYFLEDVGILGILATFGILGVIWLLTLLVDLYRSWKNSQSPYASMLLIGYIIITAFTLSLFNVQRILYLFIILYCLDYLTKKKSQHQEEQIKWSL